MVACVFYVTGELTQLRRCRSSSAARLVVVMLVAGVLVVAKLKTYKPGTLLAFASNSN